MMDFYSRQLLPTVCETSERKPETRVESNCSSKITKNRTKMKTLVADDIDRQLTVSHSYDAIKLTNYFTNLLHQQQQHQHQQTAGENWRAQQLSHQIPQQDIRLLTSSPTNCDQDSTSPPKQKHHHHNNNHNHHPSVSDEIKFIRGQRKMASQFKASLYYLNPTKVNSENQANDPAVKQQQQAEQNGLPKSQNEHHQVPTKNKSAKQSKNIRHTCFKVSLSTSNRETSAYTWSGNK